MPARSKQARSIHSIAPHFTFDPHLANCDFRAALLPASQACRCFGANPTAHDGQKQQPRTTRRSPRHICTDISLIAHRTLAHLHAARSAVGEPRHFRPTSEITLLSTVCSIPQPAHRPSPAALIGLGHLDDKTRDTKTLDSDDDRSIADERAPYLLLLRVDDSQLHYPTLHTDPDMNASRPSQRRSPGAADPGPPPAVPPRSISPAVGMGVGTNRPVAPRSSTSSRQVQPTFAGSGSVSGREGSGSRGEGTRRANVCY